MLSPATSYCVDLDAEAPRCSVARLMSVAGMAGALGGQMWWCKVSKWTCPTPTLMTESRLIPNRKPQRGIVCGRLHCFWSRVLS